MSRKSFRLLSSLGGTLVGSVLLACCSGPGASSSTSGGGGHGMGGNAGRGGGVPFQADAPEVYVAKVKNLLVGLPPKDEEVKAVKANPDALKGLVDQWMATPQYEAKMRVFFELAFQQTQITQADFIDMLGKDGLTNGAGAQYLLENVRESFARTVVELVKEGRPLTEAMTTKRLMMTPPLMELYAFLDTYHVADDPTAKGATTDGFAKQYPNAHVVLESSAGPIPLAETVDPNSPNFMHWYDPDIASLQYAKQPACNGVDPIDYGASGFAVHYVLYGGVLNHRVNKENCGNRSGQTMQFAPGDFDDWKMVTIRAPKGGEPITRFFDIGALRSSSELVLKTPRPGFFSTPAFFANWSTNTSNQMRVTLNQALIVATGMAVDGTDPTIPSSTPDLDSEHAPKGGACFGCHQTLDPTRAILSANYTYQYFLQEDPQQVAKKGLFVFQGVEKQVETIDDFANALGTHPAFAAAWAQKLCYYANSVACATDDPEFQRIVKAFQDSGYQWTTLVRELFASPITTNAAATKTTADDETVAVARRDHLCAALDNRLGFVDICGLNPANKGSKGGKNTVVPQIVAGLPSDGYGRGSTVPVLPNLPTLFYRSGVENICVAIANKVVDGAADPNNPDMKHWSSAQSDAAITEMVELVMGLVPSDPRNAQATTLLKAHFASATKTGASASDALKSTFVTACLAPSAVGIGM